MDTIVQSSVVLNLSRRPATVRTGPFVIGWDPTTDSRFVNYATPLPGAAITANDVAELVAAFGSVERLPRLEYVTSCAPGLERLLLDAGFTVEARNEYLTCSPRTLRTAAEPAGVEFGEPTTDEERAGVVTAQNAAFGSADVAGPDDVARIHQAQRDGGVLVYARDLDGSYVGGALATAPAVGLSEVTGIAVREPYRRRGIAGALTALVTRRVFETGATGAWLEASGDDSWRVYERVGYAPTGKRLYIALE
ncbi:Predicted acetyltransferase, GNAT family [Actinopolymorpha cephalotaxi]|uniref:Predicted acetyltransferase, GNAT family n=1 Tax=Actinopolymorpha cephalotaxi TaxID=504797 RepID=A0A1I3AXB5_9ACTN|nr:GNAT family N-acetyltransferase [Actinopolymorpha cephalotaxi]NYH84304.1 ribosomal protein S18 acetylase RimI-like enzyme [Actinopolymorpha cephalotaxi]SFH54758.1 Predicted acetyltransferase, GNAT family [Actinopolymorpha cephalotaxi]